MKTIGLLGGMSWESTVTYYRIINEAVRARLGGLHSAKCVLYSVDFAEIEALQREGRWEEAAGCLVAAGQGLQRAGAEVVVLCTNTMHKLAETIQAGVRVPFLHIADATAQQIERAGIRRVGLLGTRFTMEEDFFRGRLARHSHLEVMVPVPSDREEVHRIIYEELCVGTIRRESRAGISRIMVQLAEQGAGGIILGCTELGLLVGDDDSPVPLFDTTRIHALAAVAFALNPQPVAVADREGPPRKDANGRD
ncbi:MAG: aspartate/glutamate racemase family protein [Verrucomicrobia bacterium]|nr:aspartate/glutamate racemase family protein [Verrucomicrobiota bacterium]